MRASWKYPLPGAARLVASSFVQQPIMQVGEAKKGFFHGLRHAGAEKVDLQQRPQIRKSSGRERSFLPRFWWGELAQRDALMKEPRRFRFS